MLEHVPTEAERILDAAMELSDDERAELAAILGDSVGDGSSPEEIDAAWISEAKRRLRDVRSGASTPVSSEDVERELDDIVSGAPDMRRAAR